MLLNTFEFPGACECSISPLKHKNCASILSNSLFYLSCNMLVRYFISHTFALHSLRQTHREIWSVECTTLFSNAPQNWTTKIHGKGTWMEHSFTVFKTTIKEKEEHKHKDHSSVVTLRLCAVSLTGRIVFQKAGLQALNGGTGHRGRPVCGRICTVRGHVLFRASSSTDGTSWRSTCQMQNCVMCNCGEKANLFPNQYFLLNGLN